MRENARRSCGDGEGEGLSTPHSSTCLLFAKLAYGGLLLVDWRGGVCRCVIQVLDLRSHMPHKSFEFFMSLLTDTIR
jgi:hypothetical protein